MDDNKYRECVDQRASAIVTAIVDRARDSIVPFLMSNNMHPPAILFVGKLEYEVLKTEIGIRVERLRGTDNMQLTFTFETSTIQPIDQVILLVRLVPDEQRLLKVA
jgi:hypothetical protein